MRTFVKLTAALAVGALVGVSVPGCNTVKGAGKDIQKGGQSIEHAATSAQSK